ncbi:iron compound ABC transporter substrate-binding protein [Enterococcus canis]|uniref:Iron compound ABC transporter substrate-binding protein n=1 Tax=Enterococcus canis TaxID=214095 RepID=A0A1L8RKJ8_9ENTE|nr:ABC transporter substrate-binding protein [Enterococcus canis]OJG20286.1 iron compound ABC transporter substrate-binding protein [Enterococcus canis]
MKKIVFGIAAFAASALLLAGCGAGSSGNSSSSTTESSAATERTLTDSLGHEVTVPAKPKRIIASYLEDYLVALDEKPVAQWTVNNSSIQLYLQDELKDIPTIDYALPYEDVLSFEPDLLLISSSGLVEGGKYDEYSKIAPTYVVKNGETVNWREQLADVGKVLGKETEAKQVEADYDALAKETKTALEKKGDQSAAVLWIVNNQAFMVSETRSSGAVLYGDLGMTVPGLVKEISQEATADWNAVSLEKLSQLDADHLFIVNSDPKASLFQEDLWKNIPAVKAGNVHEFGPESSWLYNGPIANTKMIEDVKKSLLN